MSRWRNDPPVRHRQHEHASGAGELPARGQTSRHPDRRLVRWDSAARLGRISPVAARLEGAALCSVVPRATPLVCSDAVKRLWHLPCLELTPETLRGVGIDYPQPQTIGPDRLANAVAARHRFGAPAVVVDFGTAVTFDVVDRAGQLRRRHHRARVGGDDRLSAREDGAAAANPHSGSQRARSARAPSRRCWWARCMAIAGWFAS